MEENKDTQHEPETAAPAAEEEMSMADLLKEGEAVSSKLYGRDIVEVTVVQVTADAVLVNIGEKKEGIIPLSDFQDKKPPEPGAVIQAVLEKKGGEGRPTILSHKRAHERVAWQECARAFTAKARLKGRVAAKVKGGYVVDVDGLRGFMPLSLSEIGGAHRHYLPDNAKVKFYITDFSAAEHKLIVSRRQVLEEDENARRGEVLAEIKTGEIIRAVVSKVVADGAFLRFQGIEGFVRLSDVSWRKPEEDLKTLKRGQRVKAKILSIDRETEKISFGLKHLMPNPVDTLKQRFAYRSIVTAKVVSVSPDGAKVTVGERVEGFLPAAEYGHEAVPAEGGQVKAAVIGVNAQDYTLTLSVRSVEAIEDRKRMAQYLKGAPTLTLGQILLESSEDEGENG
ncbi:MAG: small subunit ribosomal protein S1 [Elusimicrobia bacterium]|nr:MAG: small subunit ribosomal protein S1 [Elusimicrobiota bacterium]KAF0156467.1 MAG: small subunit ribosomal protein S1 [Elusimicrobiota bacterium]